MFSNKVFGIPRIVWIVVWIGSVLYLRYLRSTPEIKRSNRNSEILQREDMTMRDKMLLIDELDEQDRQAESVIESNLEVDESVRGLFSNAEPKEVIGFAKRANKHTALGQFCLSVALHYKMMNEERFLEEDWNEWEKKSAEQGFYLAIFNRSMNTKDRDESLMWDLINVHACTVMKSEGVLSDEQFEKQTKRSTARISSSKRIYEDTFSEAERLINLFSGSGYLLQQGVIPSSFYFDATKFDSPMLTVKSDASISIWQELKTAWNFTVLETSSRPKKPSAEEIEQRMSEIKRKRIAEMEAKIDESTPKGQYLRGELIAYQTGDKWSPSAINWYLKSAEGGYEQAYAFLSSYGIGGMESLKFGIIEAYIYRLADNANFAYPDGGYKSYSEANAGCHRFLAAGNAKPLDFKAKALEEAEQFIEKRAKLGFVYRNDKTTKDENLTIWADEKKKIEESLGL